MPPEPKKPIEEMLEASARARRAQFGADPQMPNPMRAQLHGEIARQNKREEPRRSWLASFWPQISLATAVAALLVTGSVLWFRGQSKMNNANMELARNAPASAPPNASDTLRSIDAPQIDRLAKSEDFKSADIAAAAPPADTASNSTGLAESSSFKEVAPAPAAAKAAAPVLAARSFTPERQALTTNLSQRFSQNASGKIGARDDSRMKRRANVLENFDIQQEGDKIRVVDQDGSTYTGKLEQITSKDQRSLAQKNQQNIVAQSAAARPAEENESNEYFFRAAGFNSSLKKNVVFEANYVAMPAENRQNAATEKATRNEQNQARIIGTARIPGEPPVEVDAVSVGR